jgi:nucleoside-diphosphate-sugar epimerase
MTRLLVTGSTGVLGRVTIPRLRARGLDLDLPSTSELDLFDLASLHQAIGRVDGVLHLATRIPSPDQMQKPGAWDVNDQLRDTATSLLVRAAVDTNCQVIAVPTVAFIYPSGPVDETSPVVNVPAPLRSALQAEAHLDGFTAAAGRRGVALRLGSLYGPEATTPRPLTAMPFTFTPTTLAPR